jgi:hypothetical protein
MALKTSELHRVMRRDPTFLGVFASDRVPPIVKKHKNVKMIINLDPASKPGTHWVAIWRKCDNKGQFYDSFGRRPPPILEKWLKANSDSWIYNTKRMQNISDKTACGYLCISFLTGKFRM